VRRNQDDVRVAAGKACSQRGKFCRQAAAIGTVGRADLREVNLNDCTLDSADPTGVGAASADLRREPHIAAGQVCMNVSRTRPSTGATHGPRVAAGLPRGTGFTAHVEAPATGAAGIAAPSPLAALSTVLAAQEALDGPGERRRALTRGRSLLDELDQIRVGLLEGTPPEASIRRLAGLLQGERPAISERKLLAVLDEIELRAAVELAKRQQGRSGQAGMTRG
jgi:hypothetical protein